VEKNQKKKYKDQLGAVKRALKGGWTLSACNPSFGDNSFQPNWQCTPPKAVKFRDLSFYTLPQFLKQMGVEKPLTAKAQKAAKAAKAAKAEAKAKAKKAAAVAVVVKAAANATDWLGSEDADGNVSQYSAEYRVRTYKDADGNRRWLSCVHNMCVSDDERKAAAATQ
jgi:hypothetical protein